MATKAPPQKASRKHKAEPAAAAPPKARLTRNVVNAAYLDKPAHLRTRQERSEAGKALRVSCPRESQAGFKPAEDRIDPIELLMRSSEGRIEHLVPIRYGRMLASPFAFYRGAAAIMAADLAGTPCTGLGVQACGDAHLMNFGAFATPERRIIFDINDFDETYPAPWEWDLKRLAASFVIASLHNDHKPSEARAAAAEVVDHYRERMRELAAMPTLAAWYSYLDAEKLIEMTEDDEVRRRRRKVLDKALQRDAMAELVKLAHNKGGQPRIRDEPPLVFHPDEFDEPGFDARMRDSYRRYRDSLPTERHVLLDRYEIADVAMKVVGVGSVGTRCAIVLLFAAEDDPLFLQVKEARESVLAPYIQYKGFASNGERVVLGQRLMQAASDVFLGHYIAEGGQHMYTRQLRDVKVKPMVETYTPRDMLGYARSTGWALARAHARTGDACVISGYIGKGDELVEAIADFAVDYAAQNQRDHAALRAAVRSGRLEANTAAG